MSPSQKAKHIQKILEQLYPHPAIPLKHTDPYTLLIAVLLSAQCTDKCVNSVTPALFAKADTPQKMVALSIPEIQQLIQRCGLSRTKAKNIWLLSQQLLEKHQGHVPRTFADLENLPGVGHKTASVVMTQAFKKAAFPVDTHIHRCAVRWGLSKGKNIKTVEADLKKLFPSKAWPKLHLQMIYFARQFCPALRHDMQKCPICSWLKNVQHQKREPHEN